MVIDLPAGDYFVAAVEDPERDLLNDPTVLAELAAGASHVSLRDGERTVQNVQVKTPAPR
ncbi:MAG: hypothetical protein ABJC89_18705 [Acidobacteriota bacterium]